MISEPKPLVKNAADKAQVKAAEYKQKRGRERELDDVRSVLSSAEGRRFVWRYLGEAGVFKTSFHGNLETFINEGQRMIGLKLLSDINEANPNAYVQMLEESRRSQND